MRHPIKQTCPNCDHTFRTKWGLSEKDIDKMRDDAFNRKEKILSHNFLDEDDLDIQIELKKQEKEGKTDLRDLIDKNNIKLNIKPKKKGVFSSLLNLLRFGTQ